MENEVERWKINEQGFIHGTPEWEGELDVTGPFSARKTLLTIYRLAGQLYYQIRPFHEIATSNSTLVIAPGQIPAEYLPENEELNPFMITFNYFVFLGFMRLETNGRITFPDFTGISIPSNTNMEIGWEGNVVCLDAK
jgi:hypothetical protein